MTTVQLAANGIVGLVNVLFFAIIQTIFFVLVASRELDRDQGPKQTKTKIQLKKRRVFLFPGIVVEAKSRILTILRQQLQRGRIDRGVNVLDWQVHQMGERAKQAHPEATSAARRSKNRSLLIRWIGPVLLTLIVVIVALSIFLSVRRHGFPFSHRVGLALVFCVYIVEILLFVFVIERYTMVGDYELLQLAFKLPSSSS